MKDLFSPPSSVVLSLWLLIAGLTNCGVLYAQDAPVTTLSSVSADPGTTVSILAKVSGFNNISTMTLYVAYNSANMTFSTGAGNAALPNFTMSEPQYIGNGKMMIALSFAKYTGGGVTLSNNATLFTLNFSYIGGNSPVGFLNTVDYSCEYTSGLDVLVDEPASLFYYDGGVIMNLLPPYDSITVITTLQRSDGSGYVDVYFNLSGLASAYNITMKASFDGGSTYTPIPPAFLSGDITGISPGSNKHIVWDGMGFAPNTYSTQAKLELTATVVIGLGIPCPGMASFTDPRDGQTYNTVQIGSQCWMKENLKYLPSVVGPATGSNTAPYSYVYGYSGTNVSAAKATENYQNYGALYNWSASLTACPPGWHLPSDAEWTQLVDYVVAQGYPNQVDYPNGAGNALKSCRQVNSPMGGDCNTSVHPRWESHGTHYGFDEFGFSAFPGGYRYTYGTFNGIGQVGYWWSSSEYSSTYAWFRVMTYYYGNMDGYYNKGYYGFSVRCLRD